MQKRSTRSGASFSYRSVADIRQESHLTCALNGDRQLTLMQCAGARHAAGQDLRTLGNELTQLCGILVIDHSDLVRAENADLLSSAVCAGTEGTLIFSSIHRGFQTFLTRKFK